MASNCTAGEQGFAGAYVFLGCVFSISVIYESCKLIYRYRSHTATPRTPKYVLYFSMLFVFISMLSLIKCIVYGLLQCDYAIFQQSFNMSLIQTLSQDLYVIQLYILWLVLMMRLYYTFKETPFQLTKLTIQMYSVTFLFLPFICFLWISPSTYSLFIVISYSLSIFITLSIVILFCYKLVQLNRYKEWHTTKQYTQYTQIHGLDLLTLITKHTVLVLIATLFSFAMLLILITIFVLNVYEVSLIAQEQLVDVCLLLDAYITAMCVLFQFKYLHRKYEFCCSCLDTICKTNCNKYFSISLNISQEIQLTNIMEEEDEKGNVSLLDAPSGYHEPIKSNSVMNKNESIDDMLRRLHAQQHLNQPLQPPPPQSLPPMPQNVFQNISDKSVQRMLIKRGFPKVFTKRAIVVYQKHYGTKRYDLAIIEEIIYRLAVKEKLRELKAVKNLYQSRQTVHEILSSLNFSLRYINLAMLLYEVMAEMFEIGKYHQDIYDLELITELIMRLRAKFTDYGDLLKEKARAPLQSMQYIAPHITDGSPVPNKTAEYQGHIPQRTATTDTGIFNVVNHRMMSMSPDGFIDTQLVMKNAQTNTTVMSADSVTVSAAAPSSTCGDDRKEDVEEEEEEDEEEDPNEHAIEIDYQTNMNDIRGEAPMAESEPMEVDATPRGRPQAPKHKDYNVIIDFINTPKDNQPHHSPHNQHNKGKSHRHMSSSGEPITMEISDDDEEDSEDSGDEYQDDEKGVTRMSTIQSDFSFAARMKSIVVSPGPEGGPIRENEMNYANMMVNAVRIEKEVLDTEKTYLEGLYVLYDEFIVPIFARKLLHERYRKQVTSIIPQLITFHEQFYRELQSGSIPRVFNKQSDFLRMYIAYITEYKAILDIFGNTGTRNKKLHNFLEHKRITENKALISYLILPIQRIPRYMLLLSELKKKTPKHHEFEYRDIEEALQRVEIICDEINEKQREIENMSQCLLVSNKLKGLNINIVEPQRKYIDHFIFKQKKGRKRNDQFFVFNDIVIIADVKWRIQEVVSLMNFEAKRPPKTKNKEVKIRIIKDHMEVDAPAIAYVVAHDIPQKEQHENVSDIQLFCKTLSKYRSRLYHNHSNQHIIQHQNNNNNGRQSQGGQGAFVDRTGTWDSDEQVFREEQETEEFAKWKHSTSKGKKSKVEHMLKSRSEALLPAPFAD